MDLRKIALIGFLAVPGMGLHSPVPVEAAATCESLSSLNLANTTITAAQIVAAGTFTMPGGGARGGAPQNAPIKDLPAFCRISATLKPTSDSDIKIETWLPMSNWNGKFQAVGNGGWAGVISYDAMVDALRLGYATTSTDTGHTARNGSFAIGHWEKYVDFAERSVHEMTVQAKAMITAFYGNAPKYSYWNGCSTGGRQGLTEAQRFPNDFDGIIAGAPATPRTRLSTWQLTLANRALKEPAAFIPPGKYPMIHQAVLTACDASDGVKDGLIESPIQCNFDPKVLACKSEDNATCLTTKQVEAAKLVMTPVKLQHGRALPTFEPGTELLWGNVVSGPDAPVLANGIDFYRSIVFQNPNWDWQTFDLERDFPLAQKADKGQLDAVDADLKRFTEHGGKLILYHGWNDGNVPAQSTVNYYKDLADKMGGAKTSEFARLFMVPGMAHCGGGEGPNVFDMVSALDQWIANGKAPTQVIASQNTNGNVGRTRPLCPFPQVARYKGTGSVDEAANFACSMP